ncbi:MAG: leucyl/phenylalanyl-tRNA--protein transferase [Xanthomonadaceae bacterium]|nr:leucyl/phenylalanyl-tRNA--protein transferase [Xanthomonadaceae bacterium]
MKERLQGPFWLDPQDPDGPFPPVEYALQEPDGLLAVGGDLTPTRLLRAYRQGIFPWYNTGQPILWWSPDPRAILLPSELHVSRSLRKTLRRAPWRISLDQAFDQVITACAGSRPGADGTWITAEMQAAYRELHHRGYAHSVEVWENERLAGGLYGIAIGRVFFGESMFSLATDASKVAFVHLVRQLLDWGFELIDCQMQTGHLARFGARPLARETFIAHLAGACVRPDMPAPWTLDPAIAMALRQ